MKFVQVFLLSFSLIELICGASVTIIDSNINEETVTENAVKPTKTNTEDADFWRKSAMRTLRSRLDSTESGLDKLKAKNILVYIGDGMGVTTITAGRIYKGQLKNKSGEEESLVFDNFPYTGLAKTYNVDKQVPDSAGTATAMFTGVKTFYGVIGMDSSTTKADSNQGRLDSIMDWALAAGKRIGIVTTTRITHATPAATYAKIFHRDWECDTKVPSDAPSHMDIAMQLVDRSPGNKFNVIMGGGLSPMGSLDVNEKRTVNFTGETEEVCTRADGRNLTADWLKLEPTENRYFVKTRDQLMKIDGSKTEHLLGLFRNNHITYAIGKEKDEPTLEEMVEKAISVLDRPNSNGFVLMVEGGRIDQAHHQNYARAAMREVVEFDKAVGKGVQMTNKKDTLIIVTADHSHAVTLNGYPKRGNDILGFGNKSTSVEPYETLMYANGPGFYDHRYTNESTGKIVYGTWKALEERSPEERQSPTYRHMATFPLGDETHGGEDVAVFAYGAGSSLVRGVFEQNYIAHVMGYVGCMGPSSTIDDVCKTGSGSSRIIAAHSIILISVILFLFKMLF